MIAIGAIACLPLVVRWAGDGFTFAGNRVSPWNHLAVSGLAVAIIGFATFTFTLVLHAMTLKGWRKRPAVDLTA